MKKSLLYVANWKMYLLPTQEESWVLTNKKELEELTHASATIALAPSFVSLQHIKKQLKKTSLFVAAQSCSMYAQGAYTGQISAGSLADIGCSYCIVGHSEQRKLEHEDDETIAQKVFSLWKHGIIPILCIGEQHEEHHIRHEVITRQLEPIRTIIKQNYVDAPLIIAYEPVWAIGTGTVASPAIVSEVFGYITSIMKQALPPSKLTLLYGGSISATTVTEFKNVPDIGGFLIGSASTDFQEFKKIVLS